MKTYFVFFDLGIYRFDYSKKDGFKVSTNDSISEFHYLRENTIFDYIKLENYNEQISLQIHNDFVVKSYLNEYACYINNILQSQKGNIVPLHFNCFAINFNGNLEEMLNAITHSNSYRFIHAIVLPLEQFESNLNREVLFQLDYLKQKEKKVPAEKNVHE